jgi:Asp/Glu/hydantoin racemase
VARRRAQLTETTVPSHIEFEFEAVKASCEMFDSYHDWVLADLGLLEAGLDAQTRGYDAVCVDTMSDSGVNALRSVLDIPVIGPARASFHLALMLGSRFGVVTQWTPWIPETVKVAAEYGLADRLASVRAIDVKPDLDDLLTGKEDVFPLLLEAAELCVEDGADVICLASTTMHEAHAYLAAHLPVPVINPGPVTYKLAEMVLALGLTHSRRAYQRPMRPKLDMIRAMVRAAAAHETGDGVDGSLQGDAESSSH